MVDSCAVFLAATKPTVLLESALAPEIVNSEDTVLKLALHELAVSNEAALKLTGFELDVDEDRHTKVPPIPIALRKLAAEKESMHHCAFGRYGVKGAIAVKMLRPIGDIAIRSCIRFAIELHACALTCYGRQTGLMNKATYTHDSLPWIL
jgi:hypothetical protein